MFMFINFYFNFSKRMISKKRFDELLPIYPSNSALTATLSFIILLAACAMPAAS